MWRRHCGKPVRRCWAGHETGPERDCPPPGAAGSRCGGGGGLGPGLPKRELEGTVTPRLLGGGCPFCLPGEQIWIGTCATVPQGVLFAVTLGVETDRLLRRWSVSPWPRRRWARRGVRGVVDDLCRLLRRPVAPTGGRGIPDTPFSPGYGDWSLAAQDRLWDLPRPQSGSG